MNYVEAELPESGDELPPPPKNVSRSVIETTNTKHEMISSLANRVANNTHSSHLSWYYWFNDISIFSVLFSLFNSASVCAYRVCVCVLLNARKMSTEEFLGEEFKQTPNTSSQRTYNFSFVLLWKAIKNHAIHFLRSQSQSILDSIRSYIDTSSSTIASSSLGMSFQLKH